MILALAEPLQYFWAIFASIVLLLVIWGLVSSNLKQSRIRKATKAASIAYPVINQHLAAGKRYNVFLSHGLLLENVLFLGISDSNEADWDTMPNHLKQWLVLEKESKQRVYVLPSSIRYYEDAVSSDRSDSI